jgi:hypothetical protein
MIESMNAGIPVPPNAPIGLADTSVERYKPTKQENLRDYRIEIEFLSVGCVIRVGCKSVPFSTVKEGMEALNAYVKDPIELRKIWEEKFSKEEEL